jgi:hypothetical protein
MKTFSLSSKSKVEVNGLNGARPNITSKGSNLLIFTIVCIFCWTNSNKNKKTKRQKGKQLLKGLYEGFRPKNKK